MDFLDDDFDEMECFWYLREPLQLTLHCSGWINEDDYRESVYKQPIWWSSENWNLVSDQVNDPADNYFTPDEEPTYEL